jgi:hypothetical protein
MFSMRNSPRNRLFASVTRLMRLHSPQGNGWAGINEAVLLLI